MVKLVVRLVVPLVYFTALSCSQSASLHVCLLLLLFWSDNMFFETLRCVLAIFLDIYVKTAWDSGLLVFFCRTPLSTVYPHYLVWTQFQGQAKADHQSQSFGIESFHQWLVEHSPDEKLRSDKDAAQCNERGKSKKKHLFSYLPPLLYRQPCARPLITTLSSICDSEPQWQ